jgi:outer membrane protein OmpA-like peptidoglycan-associated protein
VTGTTQPATARSVDVTVNFASGSAALTPDAMHTLDAIGKALSDNRLAQYRFDIEGHTDTVGTKDYNKALSMNRAEAVVTYIETKYGIAASRLQAIGKGSDDLLVATPDQTPEPRNRRVRLVAVGA